MLGSKMKGNLVSKEGISWPKETPVIHEIWRIESPHLAIELNFKRIVQNLSEVCTLLNGTRKGKLGGMLNSEHKGPSDDSDKQTQQENELWGKGEREKVTGFC